MQGPFANVTGHDTIFPREEDEEAQTFFVVGVLGMLL